MNYIKKTALINSLLTSLYIVAVGLFLYIGGTIKIGQHAAFLAPIALLFLFVFSAALTGYLLVGKPAQMYIDGKKKDALNLITHTLGFFFIFTLVALVLLFLVSR